MAIYYIDPHTTTNGTGTFASPWSFSSATRTGLAAGDEIRIEGVALTSLLTATSYTATVTSKYQLTITAGGGLGADWSVNDLCYIPLWDVFFKVVAKSTNIISCASSGTILPLLDTSVTSLAIRRVNITSYPVSTTTNSYNFFSNLANITVSDCWISETTRVTDGSVKTIINTSNTNSQVTAELSGSSFLAITGCTWNLQNTHFCQGNTTGAGAGVRVNLQCMSGVCNIGQIFGGHDTAIAFSGTQYNSNINVRVMGGAFSSAFYGANSTYTIDNIVMDNISNIIFGGNGNAYAADMTFNIGNIIHSTMDTWTYPILKVQASNKITVNLNGTLDNFGTNFFHTLVTASGLVSVNFGSSFQALRSKRTLTQTSVANVNYFFATPAPIVAIDTVIFPDVSLPAGWTASNTLNIASVSISADQNTTYPKQPPILKLNYSGGTIAGDKRPRLNTSGSNLLVTRRDGGDPIEYLCPDTGYPGSITANIGPYVQPDASMFKTTGPSLKTYLPTWSAEVWPSYYQAKAYKTIKIPVIAGTSYTVTGWIRCDDSAYDNGDCSVSIMFNEAELDIQSMTTSCVNAWEQFTMTFTAPQTSEVVFSWGMYFSNGNKSYWLDDLTIS